MEAPKCDRLLARLGAPPSVAPPLMLLFPRGLKRFFRSSLSSHPFETTSVTLTLCDSQSMRYSCFVNATEDQEGNPGRLRFARMSRRGMTSLGLIPSPVA